MKLTRLRKNGKVNSLRKWLIRILAGIFNKLEAASLLWQYEQYRRKYDIDPSFQFNGKGIILYGGGKIVLGPGSYIGRFSQIQAKPGERVIVGAKVHISHFVKIYTGSTVPDQDFTVNDKLQKRTGSVIIGDGCWIGAGVFIREGVTIGEDTVVGANSVVTHDLPAHCIAAGCPAQVIRYKRNLSVK